MFPTLGGATYGGAVYAGAPLGVAAGFAVRLAGVPAAARGFEVEALVVRQRVDQRATAEVALLARGAPATLTPGTRLDVADWAGRPLFTGTIERVTRTLLQTSGRAVRLEATAVDATQVADRRLITDRVSFDADDGHPNGWPAGEVVRSLVNSYLEGEGLTARSVEVGSYVSASFEFESVASALTKLAEATGWRWFVDAHRDVTFAPRSYAVAPWPIVQAYAVEVQSTPGLVGYWRLGEASGTTTAVDLGPYGIHATYVASPVLGTAGLVTGDPDTAVRFTAGTSEGAVTAQHSALNATTALTLETWFRPSSFAVGTNFNLIAREDFTNFLGYRLFLAGTGTNSNQVDFGIGNGTMRQFLASSGVPIGSRAHLVGTFESSLMQVWLNGQLIASAATSITAISNVNTTLALARYLNGGERFAGIQDESAVYTVKLSSAQIIEHYQAGRDVWTHRPLLEAVRVEDTRERLRTRQVVMGLTSEIASEGADFPNAWTAVNTFTLASLGADVRSTYPVFRVTPTPSGGGLFRTLQLTVPSRLEFEFGPSTLVFPTSENAVFLLVGATDRGLGTALHYESRSGGDRFGVTEATSWLGVTPATATRSIAQQGLQTLWAITVQSTYLTVTVSGTEVGSFAFSYRGPYVGVTMPLSSQGGTAYDLRYLSWPTSGGTAARADVRDAAAVAAIQAAEGGTGEYAAIAQLSPLTLVSSDRLLALATDRLRRFSTPPFVLTYTTEEPGIRAGMLQHVHVTAFGLHDHAMLAEAVEIRRDEDQRLRYTVSLVSDEQQGLEGDDFWRDLA